MGGKEGAGGARAQQELELMREQFRVVSELGMKLATTLEPTTLLPTIVTEARHFTRSEAGSLYVREGDFLVFRVAQNDRLDSEGSALDDLPSVKLPMDATTFAGRAAAERRTLTIDDARTDAAHGQRAQQEFHYVVQSMLVVPMVDSRSEVVGVLQLMNALDDRGAIRPYTGHEAWLSTVLASHAATAMGIARLYDELNEVFEALVRYSTSAIDARDPCTAGHSSRVGSYARQVAQAMGTFTDLELREIRFAGIFHDVGKIGVREQVLRKSDKIDAAGVATLEARFAAAAEAAWRETAGATGAAPIAAAADSARARVQRLREALEFIKRVNHPAWLEDHDARRIEDLAAETWTDWEGLPHPLLTEAEREALLVRKGNLTESERREIEQHAVMGYKFLTQIPFKSDLARIPELVYCHHEKMNGAGYPRGLKGEEISLQGRILAACDVFDALTAADRPYKKAMAPLRAVEIIEREAEMGYWDREVVAVLRRLVEGGRFAKQTHGADESPIGAGDAW